MNNSVPQIPAPRLSWLRLLDGSFLSVDSIKMVKPYYNDVLIDLKEGGYSWEIVSGSNIGDTWTAKDLVGVIMSHIMHGIANSDIPGVLCIDRLRSRTFTHDIEGCPLVSDKPVPKDVFIPAAKNDEPGCDVCNDKPGYCDWCGGTEPEGKVN